MTIHYHGTPITPRRALYELVGRCFCVSFAQPQDVKIVHQIGQAVLLDNGAFTAWTKGAQLDLPGFYRFCDEWLDWPTTTAVIPDVIDGSEAENDALLLEWPFGERGWPVWHMHESIGRLLAIADRWPRFCFGSSGQYAEVGSERWHRRATEAFNALGRGFPRMPWVHMLRGMSQAGGPYPFASVDSTDIARNHNRPQNSPGAMAARWDAINAPGRWVPRLEQAELLEAS